jgi:AraC-like DNA-binding protein
VVQPAALLRELELRYAMTDRDGFFRTALEGVRFFRTTRPVRRAPLLYDAGIIIIGQGHKVGYLGDSRFHYGGDTYLVMSVPIPFECETHASPELPMLGIFVDLDLTVLREQVEALEASRQMQPVAPDLWARGLSPARFDEPMRAATERLLRITLDPLESRLLGRSAVAEIIFRALNGPNADALRALARAEHHYARIAGALSVIHAQYSEALSVERLAREAGMSTSTFHRAFKSITQQTPLQYLKSVRLQKARVLLLRGERVNATAHEVGYESTSQFSREFKRYFDAPPSAAASIAYNEVYDGDAGLGT